MNNENIHIRLDQDLTDQMTVNKNLSQEIIVTNTDKVTILLNDHHKIVKKKTEWLSPIGIFISVFATLLTAKFDETKFGVSPDLWKSVFIVVCFVSFGYSAYLVVLAIYYRNNGTISEFIRKLKNESVKQELFQTQTTSISETQIEIISATYIWNSGQADVTSKISNLISNGINTIMVDPSTFEIKDPAKGETKTLKIHCKVKGEEKEFSHTDGQRFRIE